MIVRTASDNDVPAIVELLRQSLGEGLMPKSETYWQWKHEQNPFGPSPVLLAEENGTIIGVRAFLRWKWTDGKRVYMALRAVDTATHPGHQGRGIFKKLTLQLIDASRETTDFIFNTPNEKSKPGYLKMGWEEAGRLPLNFKLSNPLRTAWRMLGAGEERQTPLTGDLSAVLNHAGLQDLLSYPVTAKDKLHTVYTHAYLKWRYVDVPVASYYGRALEHSGVLKGIFIYRIKPSRIGRELRITDVFARSAGDAAALLPLVEEQIREHKIDYVTAGRLNEYLSIFPSSFIGRYLKGPAVTVRKVKNEVNNLIGFGHWHPSLGDLELF